MRQAGGDETNDADGDTNQQDSLHPKPIGQRPAQEKQPLLTERA